jgi:predicted Rossmann fold flavoprotein
LIKTSPPSTHDVIIIGAGAAGLMCAITAGARGARVIVLDHLDYVGSKILISGGGRCNFTNIGTTAQNFISQNPHFARSALSRYTPSDFLALVEKHKIAWHEKTLGQLFCDGSAKQIVAMLMAESASAGVDIRLNVKISDLRKSENFVVDSSMGGFEAKQLVLATGGLSIPKMGASGFSLEAAKKFGLRLVQHKPGLVPLKAPADVLQFYTDLSGLAVPAVSHVGKMKFAENILFTHRGLSGPAVLQASSYLEADDLLVIDMVPSLDVMQHLKLRKHERPKAELKTILSELVPQRLAQALSADVTMEKVSTDEIALLAEKLKNWSFVPAGTEGYAKAEVMVGGVSTDELSSKTMEAKKVPGLYVIGEAVDVTGWLGGYNFQWAWASGFAAGESISNTHTP